MTFSEAGGQGWPQLAQLALAFVLSAAIGLEREYRQKAAGLRTYTLVGFASALIMLVSKYGFADVLVANRIVLDPSRIAAQIVTGIGFIGGGVIFVRQDAVRGLTTAASVWLVAAVGMACGAGLPILAVVVTAGNFVAIFGLRALERRLPCARPSSCLLQVLYEDNRGLLRDIMAACTEHQGAVSRFSVERRGRAAPGRNGHPPTGRHVIAADISIEGVRSVTALMSALSAIDGVVSVENGEGPRESQ